MFRVGLRPATTAARILGRRSASTAVSAEEQLSIGSLGTRHGVELLQVELPKKLPDNDYNERKKNVYEHALHTTELWRRISFYVCLPAVVVCAIYVYKLEKAHEEHHKHLIEANGGVEPERKTYSYMNIRTKPYPWGNKSLFFNPKTNIPVEEDA
ncbi:cytochrome c oxidase subunit VIa-domain-containing protein [Naematelia encephala]|uniref:Cytochrome c oxidase subunit 13, mitochondrial n=1 Tax=Naematelia encephala TaxID=71784 RepID=A0A1Y2B3F3_9TREE|nr:cytochrome c oxidase subunit VIa-domain-containing protein [Naematelia encephala]